MGASEYIPDNIKLNESSDKEKAVIFKYVLEKSSDDGLRGISTPQSYILDNLIKRHLKVKMFDLGEDVRYPQETPKLKIIAALDDIIKKLTKE